MQRFLRTFSNSFLAYTESKGLVKTEKTICASSKDGLKLVYQDKRKSNTCAEASKVLTCFGTDIRKQFYHNSANCKINHFHVSAYFSKASQATFQRYDKRDGKTKWKPKPSHPARYWCQCQRSSVDAEPWFPWSNFYSWNKFFLQLVS